MKMKLKTNKHRVESNFSYSNWIFSPSFRCAIISPVRFVGGTNPTTFCRIMQICGNSLAIDITFSLLKWNIIRFRDISHRLFTVRIKFRCDLIVRAHADRLYSKEGKGRLIFRACNELVERFSTLPIDFQISMVMPTSVFVMTWSVICFAFQLTWNRHKHVNRLANHIDHSDANATTKVAISANSLMEIDWFRMPIDI